MLHNPLMEATMAELTSVEDMTISQGASAESVQAAANPFAAFKNEVSSDEQTRIDAAKTPVDDAAAKAAAEKVAETAAAEVAAAEGDEVVEAPAASGKSKFQQRIDTLRRGQSDAEARATAAEAALAEERGKKKTATTPSTTDAKTWKNDPTAPKPDDFTYGEVDPDFIIALSDWNFDRRTAALAEEQKTTSARSAAEAEASKVNAQWDTRAEAAVAKYPDFVDVVYATTDDGKPAWPASASMSRLIKGSEQGPDVAYYLAKNPKIAREIAAMPIEQQAVEFGVLKTKFAPKAETVVKVTGAPPPAANAATGKGGTPPSASSSSDFAAFEAQVKAQKAASSGRR